MHHLLRILLFSMGATGVVTFLLISILWLLNPGNAASRSADLFTLCAHFPLLLLLPVIICGVFFMVWLMLAQPLALVAYLRALHTAQEKYYKLYTPLTNISQVCTPDMQDVPQQEEQVLLLDLIQQQDIHQMILGGSGSGKTTGLRTYQHIASQQPWELVFNRGRIPVYIPLKNYSLFLKMRLQSVLPDQEEEAMQVTQSVSLLDFLCSSNQPEMRSLRYEWERLLRQGRLLLLCDGLNEVDSNYLSWVSEELMRLICDTRNRLVLTCREVDYHEQYDFVELVNEGHAARAVIYPLKSAQVQQFVECYVEQQDQQWQHTAGQIMQVIDRSRLHYHCTNPMMLSALMGIIDKIGVERGKLVDTRGRLLRETVRQLILDEQKQVQWSKNAPDEREVIRFLSELACAAHWANDRNAIQLGSPTTFKGRQHNVGIGEWCDELQLWLEEHPARGAFAHDNNQQSYLPYDDPEQILQFALSAALIEISPDGVLSFRHELIAEYFVAEYFLASVSMQQTISLPMHEELLEHVGYWSEPVAIWAGLLDDPLLLAERFAMSGESDPAYALQALALALVCVGVLWTPPQAEIQRTVVLPPSIEKAISSVMRKRADCEELAYSFTRCAEEGGQEIYYALLPLIMVEGVDDLLVLLDQKIVPDLLFVHLQDAVDNIAYEAQVKRLARALGYCGAVVVERAIQLSLPLPERSMRLRAAAINILGSTRDARAVEALIDYLSEAEPFIVERAANALIRLGSELALSRVLQMLEDRTAQPFMMHTHLAALTILGRFLDEQDVRRQLSLMHYLHVLETVIPLLTANYQVAAETQQLAREILVRQTCNRVGAGARDNRWEKVIEGLIRYLPVQDDVAARNIMQAFQEIGPVAVPFLLEQLSQSSELVCIRVIEILCMVRDPRALSPLLQLVANPAPAVQQQLASALSVYMPDSLSGLIDLVLSHPSDAIADRAAQILAGLGRPVVEPVTAVLFSVVPGRTRLLVQVLEHVSDVQSVSALIALLQMPHTEPLLTIALVRALSRFPEERVIAPLLSVLSDTNPQLYEEAANALGQLGSVALDALLKALDVREPSLLTQRVQRVLLIMSPFPGEQLIAALEHCSEAQAWQVMTVFKMQGAEAAQILVSHLLHEEERVRDYIYQTLHEMSGAVIVSPLLDALDLLAMREIVISILLKYPDAAILPLVGLLGEDERGEVASAILPQFGSAILVPLIAGLDDPRSMAQQRAQGIIIALVRQSEEPVEVVREIVHLFSQSLPPRAHEALLILLTNEFVDISVPALLEGLEDAYLIEDVSEAFARLAGREQWQDLILDSLINALYVNEQRRGAETAIVKVGAKAVPHVGELITEQRQSVAKAARDILRDIGVPALSFIWTAQSDRSNPERREAALEVFYSMRADVIKDELISLLVSDQPDDVAMAVALLLERIRDEATLHYADRVMIPELIEYVQTRGVEATNLRIIALLLLLGERAIVDHLVQTLDDYPQHRKQLIYILLLLGTETQEALLGVFQDPHTTVGLRAESAAVLAMMSAPESIAHYARNLSSYGMFTSSVVFPEQLSIALCALGGLLASGHWDVRKLQELRNTCPEDNPTRELFNVLLGMRYEPKIAQLQQELQNTRNTYKKEIIAMMAQITARQGQIHALDEELEVLRREHDFKGDELYHVHRERDLLHQSLNQALEEKSALLAKQNEIMREKDKLHSEINDVIRERDTLNKQIEIALKENQLLYAQNQQLVMQLNDPKKGR
jgi:HEAT repeat protein